MEKGQAGEIQVKGPNVFSEYWQRPQATQVYRKTAGSKPVMSAMIEEGSYKILGRSSIDIIKWGGYKICCIEIEEVFELISLLQCSVVGIPNEESETVAAALIASTAVNITELNQWMRERMPSIECLGSTKW